MKKVTTAVQIGLAIRARRLELGFTQDDFAQHVEMYPSHFGRVERGEKNASVPTLLRIATGLGMTLSRLLAKAGL